MRFIDISDRTEDDRITTIGNKVTQDNVTVGFFVEREGKNRSKGDRYISKLKEKFPQITVIGRFDGPGEEVETIKVGIVQ